MSGSGKIYTFLRFRDPSHIFVSERNESNETSSLGIATFGDFTPVRTWNSLIVDIRLDQSLEYFLISNASRETQILSTDLALEYTVPLDISDILAVAGTKILSRDGVYEWYNDSLKKNTRFTDFIDVDRRYRL